MSGNYFYLFLGNLLYTKIDAETVESAYEKALKLHDFKEIKLLSKTETSIFFNANVDNISYRCSVSHKTVVNEDEMA